MNDGMLQIEEVAERAGLSLRFSVQQMREPLHARDTLGDQDASDDARERVSEFVALGATACEKLREQLPDGDEFVKQLRRDSRSPRITAARD